VGAELGLRHAHPQCCQPHIKLRLQTVSVLEMQIPYYRRLAIRCDMARYRPQPGIIEPPTSVELEVGISFLKKQPLGGEGQIK
jgi:hypothetical protein